jgi:hypothetical protein
MASCDALRGVRGIVTGPWMKKPQVEVKVPPWSAWTAPGRIGVSAAIVAIGAFIAFSSIRANNWFGHSLTPDPAAGDIYATLSVAAEILACLIPAGIRFYSANRRALGGVPGLGVDDRNAHCGVPGVGRVRGVESQRGVQNARPPRQPCATTARHRQQGAGGQMQEARRAVSRP